jgi:UDP-N-acetylglucosamine diphosphorylase/glucosamine-1-phosphate N-acetyltransferase
MRPSVMVLAAGQGKRMRSPLPKVLHEAAGAPLLEHVLRATRPLQPRVTVVVVGHGADLVKARFAAAGVEFAVQAQQRGTGDAVASARALLQGDPGPLVVLAGDGPLITSASLERALALHSQGGGVGMTLLSAEVDNPTGLGRVVRDASGQVTAIVEERDADENVRGIREVNPGTYVFDTHLWRLLETLDNNNAAGEFYLTDLVAAYLGAGLPVRATPVVDESRLLVGVNDPEQLAQADALLRARTHD